MPDLSNQTNRDKIGMELIKKIDDACQNMYDDGHRSHLGGSLIGDPCSRKLWYVFRWVKHYKYSGRMYRLFNRGHREEERFCKWLRKIGIEVKEIDDNKKQYRISSVMGHFGGSLDGIGTFEDGTKVLLEFKTSATGSTFNKLREQGVQYVKPLHFAQMSVYGKNYGFKYAIYICINKNDDDIHVEVVELDWNLAFDLEKKAEFIILSQDPPERAFTSENYYECKYCNYVSICWGEEKLEVNCRSCKQSHPVENAEWYCSKWNSIIPKENIQDACNEWEGIC